MKNHQIVYQVFKESAIGVLVVDTTTWALMVCAIIMSGNIDDIIVDATSAELINGVTFVDTVSNHVEDKLTEIHSKEHINFLREYGFHINEKVNKITLRETASTYNKAIKIAVSHRMLRSDKIKTAMDVKLTHD